MRLHVLFVLYFALLHSASSAGNKYKNGSTANPQEFRVTIDGQQHRQGKKAVNGIIHGEFDFNTADGVYHATLYAIDEEAKFQILSLRSAKSSETTLKPAAPPITPNLNNKTSRGQNTKVFGDIEVTKDFIIAQNKPLIPIHDKYPNMFDGPPPGIANGDIIDLLHKLIHIYGYRERCRKRRCAKITGTIVNDEDGVSRIVTYVADENTPFVKLDLYSELVPEKNFGLKNFEFVWYPIKNINQSTMNDKDYDENEIDHGYHKSKGFFKLSNSTLDYINSDYIDELMVLSKEQTYRRGSFPQFDYTMNNFNYNSTSFEKIMSTQQRFKREISKQNEEIFYKNAINNMLGSKFGKSFTYEELTFSNQTGMAMSKEDVVKELFDINNYIVNMGIRVVKANIEGSKDSLTKNDDKSGVAKQPCRPVSQDAFTTEVPIKQGCAGCDIILPDKYKNQANMDDDDLLPCAPGQIPSAYPQSQQGPESTPLAKPPQAGVFPPYPKPSRPPTPPPLPSCGSNAQLIGGRCVPRAPLPFRPTYRPQTTTRPYQTYRPPTTTRPYQTYRPPTTTRPYPERSCTDLLYEFDYSVRSHGHEEKGFKGNCKIGMYFVMTKGVSTMVSYVADERGYRPRVRFVITSPLYDKKVAEMMEKIGLERFKFKWHFN